MSGLLSRAVGIHKALAHPVRLRVLAMLRGGALCVCQMTTALELAASTVSAHLADLKRAGLVAERKQGRWVYYRLVGHDELRAHLGPVWRSIQRDPQIQADARLVRELRRVGAEKLCGVNLDLKRLGIRRPLTTEARARR
jgi:DNA-binding transcriptional ArsR family regulator